MDGFMKVLFFKRRSIRRYGIGLACVLVAVILLKVFGVF